MKHEYPEGMTDPKEKAAYRRMKRAKARSLGTFVSERESQEGWVKKAVREATTYTYKAKLFNLGKGLDLQAALDELTELGATRFHELASDKELGQAYYLFESRKEAEKFKAALVGSWLYEHLSFMIPDPPCKIPADPSPPDPIGW